jgi:ABC-type branched-subunit amino acid transport system ATPase component
VPALVCGAAIGLSIAAAPVVSGFGRAQSGFRQTQSAPATTSPQQALVSRYCVTCHNDRSKTGGLSLERIYELFPNLKERLKSQGTKLSGGEQQMLAIGRILRTGARLLLLDEPTEGLAPVIVQQIGATIRRLKDDGFTILLVEQNFRFAATLADRHYVMERGRVVDTIPNALLGASMDKLHMYLGV